jgi:hypothetical protein
MTTEEAKKEIAAHPDAVLMVNPAHLGPLSPLVEVQIEVVKIRRDETVKMWASGGSSWMPSEAAVKRIGNAAGAQFVPSETSTRKEAADCWVGRAQATRRAPAGGFELGPVAEYEWDVGIQIEVMRIKGKPGKDKAKYSDIELEESRVQFLKFGRQRSNTGAVTRAILGLLAIKRGLKGLFREEGPDDDIREIVVSRIVQNTKNEMVLRASLANESRVQQLLFGGGQAQIESEPRPVEEASHSFVHEGGGGLDLGAEDSKPTESARDRARRLLKDVITKYAQQIQAPAVAKIQAVLDDTKAPEEALNKYLQQAIDFLGSLGILFPETDE